MYSRYMYIYMLLIHHPFPTLSFPRFPSSRYKLPDVRQDVLCTMEDLGLSGTWVYQGFCYWGKGNQGLGPVGELGLRCILGGWAWSGFWFFGNFFSGGFHRGKGNLGLGLSG